MATSQATINQIIPAEVMGEIFIHCIPLDPLKHKQPDVTIAPMVLCHVCSYWREIALQTHYLWTHLYHVAYLKTPVGTFDESDIAFLRWWCERVKGVPPLLRLAMAFKKDDEKLNDETQEIESGNFVPFMVHFMSNARYLNLDFHYNHLLRTLYGERPLSCPNLDTLIMCRGFGHEAPFVYFNPIQQAIDPGVYDTENYIPVTNTQYIRRFAMEDIFLSLDDVSSVLNFSNITHFYLSVNMTLKGWFSLLRESVNLTHGSFKITFDCNLQSSVWPRPKTLPHLRQMTFENFGDNLEQSFLDGLHLPALTGLRVDKHCPVTVDYLHRLLASTPALRILQLAATCPTDPGLVNSVFIPGDLNPTLPPLSSIVPHLESIYFAGSSCMVNVFDHPANVSLARSVLTGDWLQLGRPGSYISSIYLGTQWGERKAPVPSWKIYHLVDELRKSIPPGVELAVRPLSAPDLWVSEWKHGNFTDEFEELRIEC